ncbi:MAG TPA: hypothetical protein VD833_06660 [Vicinamibacterales bacterium]|nr:hypothetical protein [Vicinamibacterales bacterium]
MPEAPGLKIALKRGALVAGANWPLVAVQFIADSTLKVLLAVPVLGGIFLVALLLDADVELLLAGDIRDVVGTILAALRENPAALTFFLGAFLIVLLGGSALTFAVKAGTVAVLVDAEAAAGAIERPPLRLQALRRANRAGIEPFLEGCRRLWSRYLKLGACLLVVYGATAAVYLGLLIQGYAAADNIGVLLGWTLAAAGASSVLLVWITLVNFFYLLTQMVMAVDDVGVRTAVVRVVRFLRSSLPEVAGVFGVVFVLVILATIASILGTAGLGLISFVPVAALLALPLQVAAWLLRGFVFQYLALTALGAYLTQYRLHLHDAPMGADRGHRLA